MKLRGTKHTKDCCGLDCGPNVHSWSGIARGILRHLRLAAAKIGIVVGALERAAGHPREAPPFETWGEGCELGVAIKSGQCVLRELFLVGDHEPRAAGEPVDVIVRGGVGDYLMEEDGEGHLLAVGVLPSRGCSGGSSSRGGALPAATAWGSGGRDACVRCGTVAVIGGRGAYHLRCTGGRATCC